VPTALGALLACAQRVETRCYNICRGYASSSNDFGQGDIFLPGYCCRYECFISLFLLLMLTEFKTYIQEQAGLTDAEVELIYATALKRSLRRKEAILQQGDICRYKVFVVKGLLRIYRTKEDGSEYILQFSPENNWNVEPESYDKLTPSKYNIDALEPSEVLLWTKSNFVALQESIPQLKVFSQRIIADNIYLNRQRVFSTISSTAEEKYDEFIKNYPGVFARVPLHMVASYLGVTRETLSRIRHAQVSR
jgi:CRP-like cAMP-binding protein